MPYWFLLRLSIRATSGWRRAAAWARTSGVKNTGSSGSKAMTRIEYGLPPPAGFHSVPNDSMYTG